MKIKTSICFIIVALFMPFLTGCIELRQKIAISDNGSAKIDYKYSIPKHELALYTTGRQVIETWQEQSATHLNWITNKQAVREHFSGIGIKLTNYSKDEDRDFVNINISVEVKDIRKALLGGKFGDFALTKNSNGNYEFRALFMQTNKNTSKEDIKKIKSICEGLKLELTLETPTKIIKTTAHKQSKNKATWSFDADKDQKFLLDTPEIMVIFSGKKEDM